MGDSFSVVFFVRVFMVTKKTTIPMKMEVCMKQKRRAKGMGRVYKENGITSWKKEEILKSMN